MNKKLISFFAIATLIALGVVGYWLWPKSSMNKEEWTTFRKATPQKVESYPTTAKEKAIVKIDDKDNSKQRSPASKSPIQMPKPKRKEVESLPGRSWNLYANQEVPQKMTFKNEINKEWKSLMGQDLMRFLRPDTKVFIKKEKRLTLLERGLGRHVEQVYVKMISSEGRQYSYQAFVDSESGKVIRTWNQTIHEPMGKKTPKFRPSGFINPNGSTQF